MRRWPVAIALLAIATPALADDPVKVAFAAGDDGALIVMNAPPLETPYRLDIASFDPVASQTTAGSFGGWVNWTVGTKAARDGGYLVKKVKPGFYALNSVSQQEAWAVCFHADTLQFEAKRGQVLYLGRFDGTTAVKELQRNAILHGDLSARQGTIHHYFEGITPPRLTPVDAADLASAAAWMKQAMPKTTVAPVAAALKPARFGIGSTLFGGRVCGGYFKKKVEPAKP